MNSPRNGIIGALDIGSTKIACFIARLEGEERPKVVGIGHQLSRGIKSGAVTDMEAAVESIEGAVIAAERMAEHELKEVYVACSGGPFASSTVTATLALDGAEVAEADLRRLHDQGCAAAAGTDKELLHAVPVGYSIDGYNSIKDPRGMFGGELEAKLHVVSAAPAPLRNLALAVERAPLAIRRLVAAPYAAGLATLVEDEFELGCTLVDIGGGTTSIAAFVDGALVHVDGIPLGGQHITNDVARGLTTTAAHAERMKTLFGSAIAGPSDDREMIDVPQVGESEREAANHVPRSALISIIQPRAEEILEHVRDRLEAVRLSALVGRRVVLTGGTAQLAGLRDLAQRVLEKQVRIGRPIRLKGLAESTGGPAFAAAAGLIAYAGQERNEALRPAISTEAVPRGRLAGLARWIRDNF
jgi:cell division protein FtsA